MLNAPVESLVEAAPRQPFPLPFPLKGLISYLLEQRFVLKAPGHPLPLALLALVLLHEIDGGELGQP